MWHDTKFLNKSANTLFSLFGLLLFAAGIFWLSQRPLFTLKTIVITGMNNQSLAYINKPIIKTTALSQIKGNFFTVNLHHVQNAFEAVPWVRQATIRREWPNTLIAFVEEYQPIGTWGDSGKLLSHKGDIFTANLAEAEENGKLPEFNGPEGTGREVVARFEEFKQQFKNIHVQPESVKLSKRYAWTVKLQNGPYVELGREDREENSKIFNTRVSRFIKIYPQLVEPLGNKIERIDMRYPNGLALKVNGPIPGLDNKQTNNGSKKI